MPLLTCLSPPVMSGNMGECRLAVLGNWLPPLLIFAAAPSRLFSISTLFQELFIPTALPTFSTVFLFSCLEKPLHSFKTKRLALLLLYPLLCTRSRHLWFFSDCRFNPNYSPISKLFTTESKEKTTTTNGRRQLAKLARMKTFAALSTGLMLMSTASAALDPIVVKGSKFFEKTSGKQL